MSSRLFQKIREERGLAYSVYAFADGYDDCGLVGAYLGADAEQITSAAALIKTEIEALADAPTQEEIDRARALLKSSMMMSLESPATRIESASGQLMTLGRLLPTDEIVERLEAVTACDIKRCAEKALSGSFSVAMVGAGDAEAAANIFNP